MSSMLGDAPLSWKFKHLREFVDRTRELKRFHELVERRTEVQIERVLVFHGPTGIGKTILLDRLMHECSLHDFPFARIDFLGGTFNNPLRIMRTVRDALGAADFSEWTERVNYFYSPTTNVEVKVEVSAPEAGSVDIHDVDTVTIEGDVIAGSKVVIRDNNYYIQRPDIDPVLVQDTLTESFLQILQRYIGKRLAQDKPTILLFDSLDNADDKTVQWFWYDFVAHASDTAGLILVVTLADPPQVERSVEVYMRHRELRTLGRRYVEEYLVLRGIPKEYVPGAAMTILVEKGGNPWEMFQATEKFLEFLQDEED